MKSNHYWKHLLKGSGGRRTCGLLLAVAIVAGALASRPAKAQQPERRRAAAPDITPQDPATLKRDPQGHPDFTGMWNNEYTPDISAVFPGGNLPFTPYGLERWKNVDTKDDPTGFCLPVGPSRAFTSPFPAYFLQTPDVIGVLFEYQTTWRMFYVGGKHPDDLGAYASEFMGHSTAEWVGDALVVDTIGINDRSWLDTAGHEHSDQLHLTERFEKITDDDVRYTLTYDDSVFFKEPFTIVRHFKRASENDRILPYACEENNIDKFHLVPNKKQ